MGRKVFTQVNDLCDKYEEKFNEKIATASIVNVLIAEALIARKLIPETYIEEKYGSSNPIELGFTAKVRNEKILSPLEVQRQQIELDKKSKYFSMIYDQWEMHPDPEWRKKKIAEAEVWKDKIPDARLILALVNGESAQ